MKGTRDKRNGSVTCPPLPEFITCPSCGLDLDMESWSDDEETRCFYCGYRFFRREFTVH